MRLASLTSILSVLGFASFCLAPVACATSTDADPNDDDEVLEGEGTTDDEIRAAVIGEEDNGKTIDVPLNSSFTIALPDNAGSSGYRWAVESVDRTLGHPKITYVRPPNNGCLGCPGTRKFLWSTTSPLDLRGDHVIKLAKMRNGAPAPSGATFTVTIRIGAPSSGASCGGLASLPCPADQYCSFPVSARCGIADMPGKCVTKGRRVCPAVYAPVCSCDGKTYSNSCKAAAAGASVAKLGACAL